MKQAIILFACILFFIAKTDAQVFRPASDLEKVRCQIGNIFTKAYEEKWNENYKWFHVCCYDRHCYEKDLLILDASNTQDTVFKVNGEHMTNKLKYQATVKHILGDFTIAEIKYFNSENNTWEKLIPRN